MKNPLDQILSHQPMVILDGAMATQLEVLGADLNDPLWSAKILIESPELIKAVHRQYLEAGADIICTASYQATYAGFAVRGLDKPEADHLFRESVQLAASARTDFWAISGNSKGRTFPLIAASIGPYGAFLADGSEYHGNYDLTQPELIDWHRSQVTVLVHQKEVDLLLFETIPALAEAQAIVELMLEFPAMPYALSFSCRDGKHIAHGESFLEAVLQVGKQKQLIAVGINCTAPEHIEPLLKSIQGRTSKLIMVYPNSGERWDAANHCWLQPEKWSRISDQVKTWYQRGARIIGGCCRTRPEDITAIRQLAV